MKYSCKLQTTEIVWMIDLGTLRSVLNKDVAPLVIRYYGGRFPFHFSIHLDWRFLISSSMGGWWVFLQVPSLPLPSDSTVFLYSGSFFFFLLFFDLDFSSMPDPVSLASGLLPGSHYIFLLGGSSSFGSGSSELLLTLKGVSVLPPLGFTSVLVDGEHLRSFSVLENIWLVASCLANRWAMILLVPPPYPGDTLAGILIILTGIIILVGI